MFWSSYESVPEQSVSVPEQLVTVPEQLISFAGHLLVFCSNHKFAGRLISRLDQLQVFRNS